MTELSTGEIRDFSKVFTYFDWAKVRWDELFPEQDDMSYACFSLSPDEERLVAYKNHYGTDMDNPCYTKSTHRIWLFDLESGELNILDNQQGYVSDITWEPDGQKFALAIMTNCGCYPDYLDARIDLFDKDAEFDKRLIDEPASKIINIAWSPEKEYIAYDVYSMDLIGRLKLVNVENCTISELINTESLEDTVNKETPTLILLNDWVIE